MERDVSVGGILGELFSLLRDSARDFALFTLAIGGLTVVGVLSGLSETSSSSLNYGFVVDGTRPPASALFELVSAVVSIFGTYLLLTRFLAARGRLRTSGGRFWSYLGMSILSVIAVVLGLILLIVPGIFLLVRWSAASGFVIGAGEGVTGSMSASWAATQGHGWAIFFSAVIVLGGTSVCSGVAAAIFALAGPTAGQVLSALIEAATGGLFAALGIAIYVSVHDDGHEISEVFA